MESVWGKSASDICSKAVVEYGRLAEDLTDKAFRDDSNGVCERIEFISCLKAYYCDLNRLKWNTVSVQEMQVTETELAFVTNEIKTELTSDVGNKHEGHNAENRKDKESYTKNLLDIHQLFLDPTCQPRSFGVLQHKTLEQPETPDFEGQEDMLQ